MNNLKYIRIWKPISGFEEYYEVSNFGEIRRIHVGFKVTSTYIGKKLKFYKDKDGYLTTSLWKDNKVTGVKVHRVVATAFNKTDDHSLQINHKDGRKDRNVNWNLEWVTNKENIKHSFSVLKRKASGAALKSIKRLTIEEVKKIRIKYLKGISPEVIARRFNRHIKTIHNIGKNRVWKKVEVCL